MNSIDYHSKVAKYIGLDTVLYTELYNSFVDYFEDVDFKPVLCHGDLGLDHIFIEDEKISGLIDFGNYQTRTIHYDFAYLNFFCSNLDIETMIAGYFESESKPANFDLFVNIYTVIEGLNMMAYLIDNKEFKSVSNIYNKIKKSINLINPGLKQYLKY